MSGGEAGGEPQRKIRCAMAAKSSEGASDVTFLTVAEVAAMVRVSKMTVYRMLHNGEIPALRVGRSFRVKESDVHRYLENSYYNAG